MFLLRLAKVHFLGSGWSAVQDNTVSISGKEGTSELKVKVGESSKTFTINIKETAIVRRKNCEAQNCSMKWQLTMRRK